MGATNSTATHRFANQHAAVMATEDVILKSLTTTGGAETGNAICIGAAGTAAGNFIIYGSTTAGSYMQYDCDANAGTGRLNLLLSTLRTSEYRSLNESAAAIRMYYDVSAANSGARAIIGECYLNAAVVTTGTNHHEMNGTNGQVILQATSQLNGSGMSVSGAKGEIRGSGTQTEVNHMACVLGKWNNATTPTTGDSALLLGWSHSCAVDYGVMIKSEGSGSVTTAIGMATAVATNAFSFPAAGTAPVSTYTTEEAPTGKIAILVGGATRYLAYWD